MKTFNLILSLSKDETLLRDIGVIIPKRRLSGEASGRESRDLKPSSAGALSSPTLSAPGSARRPLATPAFLWHRPNDGVLRRQVDRRLGVEVAFAMASRKACRHGTVKPWQALLRGIFDYSVCARSLMIDPAFSIPVFALLRKGPLGARLQGHPFQDCRLAARPPSSDCKEARTENLCSGVARRRDRCTELIGDH